MMASRRALLRAGVVAPLAMAGAAFTGTALTDAGFTRNAFAATPKLVGYTASGTLSCAELDQLTGRTAWVVREYHRLGTPVPVTLNDSLLGYLDEGRQLVYSLKIPDGTAATYSACEALAADIASKGHAGNVWMVLWHEPYPELTADAYIDRYRAIAPAIRSQGVACGVCFHTYPIWRKGLDYATYWPGDDVTDFLAIDTYPSDTRYGLAADPLATISPLTSLARERGKVFGVAEFGVLAHEAAADPHQAQAWIQGFDRLGDTCRFLIYWSSSSVTHVMGLEHNDGLLVPAYRYLFDTFS